jgi:putative MFS transporter
MTRRLNDSVGCGNSQLVTFLVAAFMLLCDGQEMLVMSLVNTRLKDVWGLSASAEGTLGSCVFVGVLVGSIASGIAADTYGRKPTIIFFT